MSSLIANSFHALSSGIKCASNGCMSTELCSYCIGGLCSWCRSQMLKQPEESLLSNESGNALPAEDPWACVQIYAFLNSQRMFRKWHESPSTTVNSKLGHKETMGIEHCYTKQMKSVTHRTFQSQESTLLFKSCCHQWAARNREPTMTKTLLCLGLLTLHFQEWDSCMTKLDFERFTLTLHTLSHWAGNQHRTAKGGLLPLKKKQCVTKTCPLRNITGLKSMLSYDK